MPKPKSSPRAASPRAPKSSPKPPQTATRPKAAKGPTARAGAPVPAGDPSAAVAAFLTGCRHALRAELDTLRAIVAAAAPQLIEGIKWNAPSWRLPDGDDCITCNLSAKDRLRLVFHRGAKAKDARGTGHLLADDRGLLTWAAADRAIATFASAAELTAARPALTALVRDWLRALGG